MILLSNEAWKPNTYRISESTQQKKSKIKLWRSKRREFFSFSLFPNITSNGLCRKNDLGWENRKFLHRRNENEEEILFHKRFMLITWDVVLNNLSFLLYFSLPHPNSSTVLSLTLWCPPYTMKMKKRGKISLKCIVHKMFNF